QEELCRAAAGHCEHCVNVTVDVVTIETPADVCCDRAWPLVHDPADAVDLMHAIIHQYTATRSILLEKPRWPRADTVVGDNAVDYTAHFADRAVADKLLEPAVAW